MRHTSTHIHRVCGEVTCGDILLMFVAVLLPPLAVGIRVGCCNETFLVSILLPILLFIPGVIHAWIVILKEPAQPQK